MGKKYLILKGCSGLADRLKALVHAIIYCQITDRTLFVDWGDGMYGDRGKNIFYDYFVLKDVKYIERFEQIEAFASLTKYPKEWGERPMSGVRDLYTWSGVHPVFRNRVFRTFRKLSPSGRLGKLSGYWKRGGWKSRPTSLLDFIAGVLDSKNLRLGRDYSKSRPEDVIFYSDFGGGLNSKVKSETLLNKVGLKEELQANIERLAEKYKLSKEVIGVHVRYTDNRNYYKDSKLEKLLLRLHDKLSSLNLKSTKIFLATDSHKVEMEFEKMYGKAVIILSKIMPDSEDKPIHIWSRDSEQTGLGERVLEEAITEMWLLSKCKFLLYTGSSGFSNVARVLHNDPTTVQSWMG